MLHFTERGSGPPLLLVHGLMITGEMFDPVIEQLATDLARLLDDLAIGSTAVLGYSQGGAIAQQLALDHPARCDRLVLACTYAFNMATTREKVEGHLVPVVVNTLGMRRFATVVLAQGLKQVNTRRADWVIGLIADQDRTAMVRAWRDAMAFDSRGRLGEIRCPTLVVAGSHDQAVPLHHARMLHHGIAGSQLVIIDGVDHALIWERPQELVRVTEEFLHA